MRRSTWTTKIVLALSIILLLVAWHVGSVLLAVPVILPAPLEVGSAFFRIVTSSPFSLNIAATVVRALESFVIIVFVGTLLGIAAGYSVHVQVFLQPFLALCKATPVMSVILLAFIWFSSGTVPLFSAFLMGFPVMFIQVESGVGRISKKLVEMASMYGLGPVDRIRHLVLPALAPSIATGAKSSLSMVWKVVIAAEVLTVPRHGVGSRLQLSQINLETADVLGWTLVAIGLTVLGDLLFDAALKLPGRIVERKHRKLAGFPQESP